ncbi:hypothetical protein PPACK8108_LOCUS12382 [Phakopsora pachyrhizi]|uniref:Uncharacterized protein n=1 Tax=Phakopsora pachyrhizi TaxID=170000 RepID=A0AAV0B371_PHAPC|nr:hypothetical protein PPACK8108_LOCUS12382 [Phakopsora pachyrhizi]
MPSGLILHNQAHLAAVNSCQAHREIPHGLATVVARPWGERESQASDLSHFLPIEATETIQVAGPALPLPLPLPLPPSPSPSLSPSPRATPMAKQLQSLGHGGFPCAPGDCLQLPGSVSPLSKRDNSITIKF